LIRAPPSTPRLSRKLTIMMKNLADGYKSHGASMGDIKTAVNLINKYSQYYLGTDEASLDVIRNEWISPGFNPESNTRLVFSPDGRAVGYAEVWDTANPPVHLWVWWCVHHDYLSNGISTFLLNWAETRARKAIPRCPEG